MMKKKQNSIRLLKKLQMKNNKKNAFVVTILLIASGIMGYFTWQKISAGINPSRPEKVAVITAVEGNCYKFDSLKNGWIKLKVHDEILQNELLMTDAVSKFDASYTDGTIVSVEEKSKVRLSCSQESNQILFEEEAAVLCNSKASVKKFFIKCKDFSDIKMEAASCASAVLRNSRFSTAVYEGKVVAVISENVENNVDKASGLFITEEGAVQRMPVVVTKPVSDMWITSGAGENSIKFEWSKNKTSIENLKFEFCTEKDFKESVISYTVNAEDQELYVLLKNGLYYWRLCAVDSEGKVTEPSEKFQSGKIHLK